MTRDERIGRGVAAYDAADHRKINPVEAALDAALADLGGLDGLDALRADRDRLREAVRLALTFDPNPMGDGPHWSVVEDALRESEATHG